MKRASAVLLGPTIIAMLGGCGSSGKSTTATSPPATAANQGSSFGAGWCVLAPSGNKADTS